MQMPCKSTGTKTAAVMFAFAAVLSYREAMAQDGTNMLFPEGAHACFAVGIPPGGRLNSLSDITSLIVRPRNPETDGDGDYPPEVESELESPGPGTILLTLIATFADDNRPEQPGRRWGSRFSCDPDGDSRDHFTCIVDDWCSDVGFDLHIDGRDRIGIEVLPDAGALGELGSPCSDLFHQSLVLPSNARALYSLDRRPEHVCR